MKYFRALRLRLTIVCAVSTGLVLAAMAAGSLWMSADQLTLQWSEAFESNLNTVYFYLRGQTVLDHAWLARTETADGLLIRVDINGNRSLYTDNHPVRGRLTDLAVEQAAAVHGFHIDVPPTGTVLPDAVTFEMEQDGRLYYAAVATVPGGGTQWYGVAVVKDRGQELAQVARLRWVFASFVALALLCLTAVSWLFTAWAVRPVRENQKRQYDFISAAGHELRSPLAVMRVSAGNIKRAPPDKVVRFADMIERECERLTRLTDDLLRVAGADSGRLDVVPAPAQPETLLLTAAERIESFAGEKGAGVRVELPESPLPPLPCDGQRVEQALAVLLDNAVRYTPQGGHIHCRVYETRRTVCFSVADSGPGIPEEEKPLVFERFYRGEASRTDKEHYGLGLSIAREIATLHRGSLTVKDSRWGGAEFVLALPKSRGARDPAPRGGGGPAS